MATTTARPTRIKQVSGVPGVATMDAELVYYRRRSTEETAAAAVARDSRVREVHLDLASRYLDRVAVLESRFGKRDTRLVSAA